MRCGVEWVNSLVIDTNVLAYIYAGAPEVGRKFADLLGDLSKKYTLVIPKLVYAELSLIFNDTNELTEFLNDTGIVIGDVGLKAYVIAAERWGMYNKKRVMMCPRCGKKIRQLECEVCGKVINIRQHILTDFIIGAFDLQTKQKKLVTNDKGYYSTYFPELTIITVH